MYLSTQRRQEVYRYFETPPRLRIPVLQFRKQIHMSGKYFKELRKDWLLSKNLSERNAEQVARLRKQIDQFHPMSDNPMAIIQALKDVPTDEEIEEKGEAEPVAGYDSDTWLESRTMRADKALIKACEGNNAQALKIFYQLTKRLIEKPTEVFIVDGRTITTLILKAERELAKGNGGMAQVSEESSLLSPELRDASGQEQPENS